MPYIRSNEEWQEKHDADMKSLACHQPTPPQTEEKTAGQVAAAAVIAHHEQEHKRCRRSGNGDSVLIEIGGKRKVSYELYDDGDCVVAFNDGEKRIYHELTLEHLASHHSTPPPPGETCKISRAETPMHSDNWIEQREKIRRIIDAMTEEELITELQKHEPRINLPLNRDKPPPPGETPDDNDQTKAILFDYICKVEERQQRENEPRADFLWLAADSTTCWGKTYAEAVAKGMAHDLMRMLVNKPTTKEAGE